MEHGIYVFDKLPNWCTVTRHFFANFWLPVHFCMQLVIKQIGHVFLCINFQAEMMLACTLMYREFKSSLDHMHIYIQFTSHTLHAKVQFIQSSLVDKNRF